MWLEWRKDRRAVGEGRKVECGQQGAPCRWSVRTLLVFCVGWGAAGEVEDWDAMEGPLWLLHWNRL